MGNGPLTCELATCANPQFCKGACSSCGKNCSDGDCSQCLLPGPAVQRSTARMADVESGALPQNPYVSNLKCDSMFDSTPTFEARGVANEYLWKEVDDDHRPAGEGNGLPHAAEQHQRNLYAETWETWEDKDAQEIEIEPDEDLPVKHFVLKFPDGSVYNGEIKGGVAHGAGKLSLVDGSCYDGEWLQGEKCGKGKEIWPDGTEYEGDFVQGCRCGKGVYKSRTGMVYTGLFQEDKMEGEGICHFSDGRMYVGQWHQGHIDGQGRMSWPNGSEYVGCYLQDLKHGEGTFTWPDGRQYRGQWVRGKQDGAGEAVDVSGVVSRGTWAAGRLESVSSSLRVRSPRDDAMQPSGSIPGDEVIAERT
mmetsp:Transcript_2151/g.3532  ORF Transcript_2151/g.3532 Transcript_2151/m.3532 type:complete len:362 (-) Transcript_2151:23-1108(-)